MNQELTIFTSHLLFYEQFMLIHNTLTKVNLHNLMSEMYKYM